MPLGALAMLAFITNKIHDWVRELVPDKLEPKLLQPISWILGIVITLLVCTVRAFAQSIEFGDYGNLNDLGIGAQVVFGFGVGCGAGVINDYKPNRLSAAQLDEVVDNAETVVVGGANAPAPIGTEGESAAKATKPAKKAAKKPAKRVTKS